MSELKPCPFCASEGEATRIGVTWFVGCAAICNVAPRSVGRDKESSIAAWNRRAPGYREGAEAMREAAAKMARVFPAGTHGALPVVPYAAALQAAAEIAAAIRALPLPEAPE